MKTFKAIYLEITLKIKALIAWSKRISIPKQRFSIYDFIKYFVQAIADGNIAMKASGVAYNIFMALFPLILFFFTLIPYIPIPNFQTELFELLNNVLPTSIWNVVEGTINDILTIKHNGLLSFGFIIAFYFATNGISSLISSLNTSKYADKSRSWIKQQLIAFFLLFVLSILTIITIALTNFGELFITLFKTHYPNTPSLVLNAMELFRWATAFLLLFIGLSLIYYWSPSERKEYKFFSTGALISSILLVFSTVGFNYYAEHFARYNALYGSIGTLLLFLFWIYLCAFVILAGFEINSTIRILSKIDREA